MAKYLQIGNNFYTVGDGSQLQQISANDIIGRRGDVPGGATLDLIRREGDIQVVDPNSISIGPKGEVLSNGRILDTGGNQAFVKPGTTIAQFGLLPQNQDFAQYLQSTGQSFNPQTGFSGASGIQNTQQYNQGVTQGTIDANTGQSVVQNVLNKLYDAGYQINPRANLDDPSVAAEFLKRAEAEVSPAYQAQFRLARENILRNIGYDLEGISLFEKNLEQRYGEQLRGIGESAAESGMAQSGRRQLSEQNLAQETQQQLNEKRRQLGFQTGNEALGFIERFGSQPVGGFGGFSSLPQRSLDYTPQVQAGVANFNRSGTQQPFYSLSDDVLNNIIGSQQKARQLDIEDLAQAYKTNQNLIRTLPL